MYDKVVEVKKDMIRTIKKKGLTRTEKYDLVKQKSRTLSDYEREILIKECYRDYDSHDRIQDIKSLITVWMAGMSMFISVISIYTDGKNVDYEFFYNLLFCVLVVIVLSILPLSWLQTYRSINMNITKYMLDILNDDK